ncbi:virginiamycin B lyase family protein [Yersinia sp. 1252 StPb PI]|uniref:Vgb family protein n=1 Tax=Yersinia sp. 1252 StPb PI TaxID=3117404 RepID=UPI003B27E4D6
MAASPSWSIAQPKVIKRYIDVGQRSVQAPRFRFTHCGVKLQMHKFTKSILTNRTMAASLLCLLMNPVHAGEPLFTGFQSPTAIVTAQDGMTYVSDWSADTVTRISADGRRTILARNIPAASGLALDSAGGLYVSSYSGHYILHIAADGKSRRIAENLATPTGIAFGRNGRLLVANRSSGEILSIDVSTGQAEIVARSLSLPVGVVEMEDGSLVASQYGGRVTRISPDGKHQEMGASFNRPGVGILSDGKDAVFVIDNGANVVRRVTFDGRSTIVVNDLSGSAVALGRGRNADLLVGTWVTGNVYSIRP